MRRIHVFGVVAAVAVVAAAIAPSLMAYATYAKWGTNDVSFYVNPANNDVSQNAAISGVQGAMEVWNTQAGTPFRFSYAGQVNDTTTGYDQRNVVIFRNQSNGNAIASTYSWWTTSSNVLVDSDVVFWDGAFTFFTGSSGCINGAYIEDVGAHEMGHAMGLGHSSVTGATMKSGYSGCSTTQRTLESDDRAGAQSLYGTGGGEPDTPPTVSVASPSNNETVPSGTAIAFSGSASDTPDGNLSSYLTWSSSIEGQIGLGASFSKVLTAGSHTITATATDSAGQTTSETRLVTVTSSNTAPTVTINSPANGATVTAGASVSFSGSASDAEEGNLTGQLVWNSSRDGQIGTGGSFTAALTAGTHIITATVTDNGGLTTESNITVSAVTSNTAPTVTINNPSNGATVTEGTSVSFSGSASDAEQGNLTSQLVWNSSRDGQIGTGGSFTSALTAGTHTITATVTDSGGLTGQKSITVIVSSLPISADPNLSARGYKVKGQHTVDLTWSGLTATSVDVYRNNVKIATTANTGSMTDSIGDRGKGSYTYKVCAAGSSTCSNEENVSF